jgi:hypothetical protein
MNLEVVVVPQLTDQMHALEVTHATAQYSGGVLQRDGGSVYQAFIIQRLILLVRRRRRMEAIGSKPRYAYSRPM